MKKFKVKKSQKEIENEKVNKIVQEVKSLEKKYSQNLIERACFRYKDANLRKRTAEKEIAKLKERLAKVEQDLKMVIKCF